ncbi:hypothetical protein N7537_007942 [Penicillium hordei]|uniref:Zn(2)-C6 fungal-type domain-containing protein n=1 Tax=Penicillium hordei TaxID=40994 RepID=A0AAD6H161_9EURO|nr:uncharacterized protein N7537_007942 [Penicillium hordei]KAJ5597858.1 hypothetical protein N7537_007942 [Penicillium hordei]
MPYFSDPNIEHAMPQRWQSLSTTAIAHEAQPIDPDILQMVNELNNDPIGSQLQQLGSLPQELGVISGPVRFHSIMTPSTFEDQLQNDQLQMSLSPRSLKSQPSTWPSSTNDSWSSVSPEDDRGETQLYAGPVHPSPYLKELYPDGFIFWDPADPAKSDKIHEKILLTQAELEQQREDTAALKRAGGSCMVCYRAKKKCGITTPCPPCSSKGNRICFRSWGDLCLIGPPTGNSLTILSFPSQEAKDNLQRMSEEVFNRMNAFKAVVNIRETYGGNCTAWHWTVTGSSITLSSKAECPVDDFLTGVTSALPLVDLVKFGDLYKHSELVWTALGMAKLFMAIQGLADARIRTSWFETTPGRLVLFYILILSFRKLAQMSQDFCPGLYIALCGKAKQNNKNRSRKENEVDPAWIAAALYYRVVCGLQDLQKNAAVARIFGPFICYLTGVREKLEDILRHVSPKHGATGKSSCRAILGDVVPSFPSSPDVDMAFWLADSEEMSSSVFRRQDSPFSPPACKMHAFLADHFPRPGHMVNHVEPHDGVLQSSATSHNTMITEEHNPVDDLPFIDQIEPFDSNGLLMFSNEYDNPFDPMAATLVDTMPLDTPMPLYGNFRQSLYNC